MIVVADTTPLNYLVLIDEVELLPTLFTRVVLPNAAWQELQDPETPLKVRQWLLKSRHPWLEVRAAGSITTPQLEPLDPGEREALQLALDLGISTVLLDEADTPDCKKPAPSGARNVGHSGARCGTRENQLRGSNTQVGSDQLPPVEVSTGGISAPQFLG